MNIDPTAKVLTSGNGGQMGSRHLLPDGPRRGGSLIALLLARGLRHDPSDDPAPFEARPRLGNGDCEVGLPSRRCLFEDCEWNRCPLHGVGSDVRVRRLWRCTAGGVPAADRYICLVAIGVIGAAASTSCTTDDSSSATSMSGASAASVGPTPALTVASSPGSSIPPREGAPTPSSTAPTPIRVDGRGHTPVSVGEPIDVADLSGRIVFDDFENIFTMRPDGTDVVTLTSQAGAEFDGTWSPDGQYVVYRDRAAASTKTTRSTSPRADGTGAHNLTNDPANDWGPDWSSDGEWIGFNSDRDGACPVATSCAQTAAT